MQNDLLKTVISTLNQVEVHGQENLARLYNVIDQLKQLDAFLSNQTKVETEVPHDSKSAKNKAE